MFGPWLGTTESIFQQPLGINVHPGMGLGQYRNFRSTAQLSFMTTEDDVSDFEQQPFADAEFAENPEQRLYLIA